MKIISIIPEIDSNANCDDNLIGNIISVYNDMMSVRGVSGYELIRGSEDKIKELFQPLNDNEKRIVFKELVESMIATDDFEVEFLKEQLSVESFQAEF